MDGTVSVSRKDENKQVDGEFKESGRDAPGPADPLNQPLTHPSTDTTQKKCIIEPMGHGYPGVIEKVSLREGLPINQGDSRAHIESNPDNIPEKFQTDLPNQDSETKPEVSPSWGDSSLGMTSGLKSSHDSIDTPLTSQGEIDLTINSRVALEGKVSDVSVIEDETPGNCSQTLKRIIQISSCLEMRLPEGLSLCPWSHNQMRP